MQKRDKLLLEAITKMQLQVTASKEAIETSINDDNKDDYKNEHTDIILNEIKELKQQISASQAEGKKDCFRSFLGRIKKRPYPYNSNVQSAKSAGKAICAFWNYSFSNIKETGF
ncbi:hypothetical protein AAAC51_45570 [Priestia megaterium]